MANAMLSLLGSYLAELAENYTDYWIDYLSRLHQAGKSRDEDVQVVKLLD